MKTLLCMLWISLAGALFSCRGGVVVSSTDDGTETLKYFVSKSDLVVVATIADEPLWIDYSAPISGFYPRTCYFKAAIDKVLAGDASHPAEIAVQAVRIQNTSERPFADLVKGRRFVFFLKRNGDAWHTADPWFGVWPYTPGLEAALSGRLDFIIVPAVRPRHP